MSWDQLSCLRTGVRAALSEAYESTVDRYGSDDIRCYGVMLTDALSSYNATLRWGIDTYSYRQVKGWDYSDASARWDVRQCAVRCGGDGASISVLIRQFNARATVDTYEDILVDVAAAIREGAVEARLPVPGFLRVNTNGGVTLPVLEGRVISVAGDDVYEL